MEIQLTIEGFELPKKRKQNVTLMDKSYFIKMNMKEKMPNLYKYIMKNGRYKN